MFQSWSKLPFEVLSIILDFFERDSKEILECQLVCRHWQAPAQSKLYSSVKILATSQAIRKFANCLVNSTSKSGLLIKKLDLQALPGHLDLPLDILLMLPAQCPNVKSFTSSFNNSKLWDALEAMVLANKWNNLECIDVAPELHLTYASYQRTMIALKYTLNTLNISSGSNLLIPHLCSFTNLTRINLSHAYPTDNTLAWVLNKCPQLKELRVNLYQIACEQSLRRHHGLKTLEIYNCDMPSDVVEYLQHSFPKLDKLHLVNCSAENGKLFTTIDKMHDLIHYASIIPEFSLAFCRTTSPIEIAEYFIKSVDTPIQVCIRYDRVSPLNGYDCFMELYRHSTSFRKPCVKGCLSYNGKIQTGICFKMLQSSTWLRLDLLLKMIGASINHLAIDFLSFGRPIVDETADALSGYILDTIFLHCSMLENLTITQSDLTNCNPSLNISTSIETLTIAKSKIAKDIFHQISVRLPSLKHLFLTDCRFLELGEHGETIIQVDMPYTAFENLVLTYNRTPDLLDLPEMVVYKGLHSRRYCVTLTSTLKISTLSGDVYYVLVGKKLRRINFRQYLAFIERIPQNTHIFIRCKSINRLHIKMGQLDLMFSPGDAWTTSILSDPLLLPQLSNV